MSYISDDPGSENYLYAQDPFEVKCQPIINKRENAGLKYWLNALLNAWIKCKILKLLMKTRMIWMIFIKILNNKIQIENAKVIN